MGETMYSDTVLVPVSLFLMMGYHAYLWHSIRTKPSTTTIGSETLKRKSWFFALYAGDDKKGMLAIQSLRNKLMIVILTATISILTTLALGALTNNAYMARDLFSGAFFGSTSSPRIVAIKYGSACLFLVTSFLCSSLALGFLVDASYLVNAITPSGIVPDCTTSQTVFERGFTFSIFGNRLLCLTFPMLMWMIGPVLVFLSSGALVWILYELDFIRRPPGARKHGLIIA